MVIVVVFVVFRLVDRCCVFRDESILHVCVVILIKIIINGEEDKEKKASR